MPHQILHEVKHQPSMKERLLRTLFSADDRTVYEGRPNSQDYTRHCNHSIWAKVTVEEVKAVAESVPGWM